LCVNTVYGKTFKWENLVCKIHYSLENFCGASGRGLHLLYTASDSRGKLSRLAKNLWKSRKFFHLKVLLYMVYSMWLITLSWLWSNNHMQLRLFLQSHSPSDTCWDENFALIMEGFYCVLYLRFHCIVIVIYLFYYLITV